MMAKDLFSFPSLARRNERHFNVWRIERELMEAFVEGMEKAQGRNYFNLETS